MNTNSNSSHDLSTHAAGRHPLPLWRSVCLGLMLAFGTVSPIASAQAAPARGENVFFVFAQTRAGDTDTMCAGQNLLVSVNVVRSTIEDGLQTKVRDVTGLWIQGSVQDPSLGKLVVMRKMIGLDGSRPWQAVFAFHADKPGKTTLNFRAEVYYYKTIVGKLLHGPVEYAESNPMQVTVEDCKYKVTINSNFEVPGLKYTAIIDEAELTPNGDGTYTGKASVTWTGSWDVLPPGAGAGGITCTSKLKAPSSQADLTGTMDDDGYLTVNIDYKPDQASWSAVCRDSSGSTPPSITPETLAASSLKTSVPASSGAGTTEVQDLTDQATGSAYIDIFRDTNQATSYNPGSLTAHLGSPVSLSMIGSDLFPQLFSSLLALH